MATAKTSREMIPTMWDGQVVDRKAEAGHARGHRGDQEQRGPPVEPLSSEQTSHDDESRSDSDQVEGERA